MGPSDHHRVTVFEGSAPDHLEQPVEPLAQQASGTVEGRAEGGVEHVARREAVVEPLPVLAHRGGEDVHERGDVVMGDGLAFLPGIDVDRRRSSHGGARSLRGDTEGLPALEGERLHLLPEVELGSLAPQRRHLGSRVPLDHAGPPAMSRLVCLPSKWIRSAAS